MKLHFNIIILSGLFTAQLHGIPGYEKLVFHQTIPTFNKITEIISKKEKGVYFRFGDGEIVVALGQEAIEQHRNHALALELQEAMRLNGPNILKTLPVYSKEFGAWETGMFLPGNHETSYVDCMRFTNMAKPLWGDEITDVYSHVALHFASTSHPQECANFLKFLKNSNCCLFVGNQHIPQHIRNLLFGPQCIFIPTAPHSCYSDIDSIEQSVLANIPKDNNYKVIVTCMGPASKALQKRLWFKLDNIFLFDFGSLMDALCGWASRDWIKVTNFNSQAFVTFLQRELLNR